uniref:LIM zinc-binding domain-containing protein n=1 Tax=Eptatretus burgeri TaxID=7764 RepID=A0A8C4NJ40_EPTBU
MPDIQKDDMATRRTSAMADQPRPAAPFNQFLPGQHNLTTGVLPGQPTVSQSNTGSQNHLTSPLVVSMSEAQQPAQLPIQQGKVDRFQVTEQKIQPRDFNWDSEDEERLGEPDVEKDDLAARRGWQGNRTPAVPHNRFLPARSDSRDVLRWENMVQSAQRLRDQAMLQIGHRQVKEKETSVSPGEQGPSLFIGAYRGRKHDPAVLPDTDRDDLARRRVGQSLPGRPQQVQAALCGPVSTSDLHTWQRLQIVCEGDREKVQSSDAVSTTELAPTPPRPASASALQPSSPFGVPARPQYVILGGMTEGDLLRWQKLRIAGDDKEEDEEDVGRKEDHVVVAGDAPPLASNAEQTSHHGIPSMKAVCTESQTNDMVTRRLMRPYVVSTKQSQPFLPSHCAEEDQQRWQAISAALRRREQEHEEKREAAKGNDGDMSTSLISLESEPGHLPGLSTYRRRESASAAEVESWQEDFARWKSRRQRASRELWKRKEEREMAEQAHASVGTRLLGTKTYREILEEKQRREQVLQNAYRQARNAGDAAAVLARYREQFLQDFAGERYELPEFLQQDLSLELEGLGLRSTQAPGLLRQLSEPPISTATPLLNAFSASSGFGNFSAGTRMAVSAQTCTLSQMTETAVSSLIPVPETQSVPTTPTTSQAPLNKINTSTSSVVPANVTNASSLTPPLNTSGSALQSTGVKNPSNPPFKSFSLDHDSQIVSPALHLFPLPADSPPSPAPLSPSRTRLVPIVVPRPYKSQSSKLHSLLNFTILDADIDKNGTSCGRPGVLSDEKRTDFSPVMEEKKTTVGMDELALGNRHGGWDPEKQRRRLEHWQKQQQKHLEKQFERQQERLQKHWEQVQLGVEIQAQKHREEEIEILAKTAMPSIRSVGEGSAMPSSPSSLSENNSHLRILEEEPEEQCNDLKTDFDLVEGTGRRNGEPSVQTEDCDLDLEGSNVEGRPESRLAEKSSALHQGPAVQTGKMLIGHQLCATCAQPVVKGPAMVIKALDLCFHVNCFKCDACGQPLAPCNEGTDVRLQDGSLRCKTCDVDSNIEVARTSTV